MNPTPALLKAMLITIVVLMAIIAALSAGILARVGGAQLTSAVSRGAVAFTATVTLLILIMTSLGVLGM
ncbi:hypothetical protein ACFV0L_33105 [Streptosporangium canum]|uniref:hypothetical protein n=1 Tax=Streptosporangium canum TaxID=324952 RepID=UPI0036AEC56C